MTQLEDAKQGNVTEEMKRIADFENHTTIDAIMKGVAAGEIVIPKNVNNSLEKPCAIGKGMKVKINANIGASPDCENKDSELTKLKIAVDAGADTVMDLTITTDPLDILKSMVKNSPVPVGTVPVYTALRTNDIYSLTEDDFFNAVEDHAKAGVDFITVHCGVNQDAMDVMQKNPRLLDIVSRGGSITYAWMKHTGKDNPFFSQYDYLLELAHEYDLTLSLGDGFRPGCIHDASDESQLSELRTLGKLVKRALEAGVQSMVEGPGHVPLNQIQKNMELEKEYCFNAPFYVLGPLVTDIAPGYDHIVGAIGGAVAAMHGADFLCYVTPAEHLSLPTEEDVREGVIASKIAAHAADLTRGIDVDRDFEMSKARKNLDWERQKLFCLNPAKIDERKLKTGEVCTMCGKHCAIKQMNDALSEK